MSGIKYEILDCSFNWTTLNSVISGTTTPVYANATFVIRCDFAPGIGSTPATISFPEGTTLQFEGGSFSGVTLTGNNTKIEAPLAHIFNTSVTLNGTFVYDTFYPEWFGAIGKGTTNDFEAFKSTFDFANHVTLTQKYSIETSEQIVVNKDENDFTLMGYGSVITNVSDTHLMNPIFQFRDIENLTIKGITVRGNSVIANALWVYDIGNVTLEDITITDLLFFHKPVDQGPDITTDRVVGIRIDILNPSVVYGNNIRISELGGGQNEVIGDPLGVARAIFCVVNHNDIATGPENTKVTFENSYFEWIYGDDGDVIHIVDTNYISDAKHRFIFNNCTIRYASRRLVKGSASGIQYYNCKFDTANEQDLRVRMGGGSVLVQPSGGVNFRNENPDEFPTFRNMHGKMINCEYRNSGNLTIGSGSVLIAAYTDGLEIRGNQFYDMYVKFQNTVANFIVDNNQFYNSNIETNLIKSADPTLNEWEEGRSYVTNNYGYYSLAVPIHPALINVKNDLVAVTIRNNKVFSKENANLEDPVNPNFFGLIRHTAGQTASDVYVSYNELVRTMTNRNELLISTVKWDSSCKIFENFNNRIGAENPIGSGLYPAAGYNFSGVTSSVKSWNNRNGNGDLTN